MLTMRQINPGIVVLLVLSMTCISCGGKGPQNRKVTVPVKGKVLVDGNPAEMLSVECNAVAGLDKGNPTVTSGVTDKDGNFSLSTYQSGDGVPEGEYTLTFQWGQLNLMKHTYEGDKLNGRYRDAAQSQVKFTAKKDSPIDLGEIKLTSH